MAKVIGAKISAPVLSAAKLRMSAITITATR
jgi:hypothetical protein